MPYHNGETRPVFADVATETLVVDMPVHEAGGLIVIPVSQDNGSTFITHNGTGWTEHGTQVKSGGSISAVFSKLAVDSNEPSITLTGHLETWSCTPFIVKDPDLTVPVEAVAQVQWTGRSPTPPAITTLTDDALLLYIIGSDNARALTPTNIGATTNVDKLKVAGGGGNAISVGLVQADAAGTYPAIPHTHENSEGGSAFVLAIRNKAGGARARCTAAGGMELMQKYGQTSPAPVYTDSSLDIASINGIATFASIPTLSTTLSLSGEVWGTATQFGWNDVAADLWVGKGHVVPAMDLTGGNLAITFELSTTNKQRFAPEGILIAFQDAALNWAAYQLSPREAIVPVKSSTYTFTPSVAQQYDSSAVQPDMTAITKIHHFHHRSNSTSLMQEKRANLVKKNTAIMVGGSVKDPVSPAFMKRAFTGWGYLDTAFLQGSGQGASTIGVQLGDGIKETYSDFTATSYETAPYGVLNQVDDYTTPFIIKQSANDTTILRSAVIKANLPNVFKFDSASSLSASQDFAGLQLIGWDVEGMVGKPYNSATFTGGKVTQFGGTFDGCTFNSATLYATDLDSILSCVFVGDTGHGAVLTSFTDGASMTWSGNATGFDAGVTGSPVTPTNTGNEALYIQQAAGTITINVASGATTPSIKSDGATVNVIGGLVSLNVAFVDGNSNPITGYEWRIYEADASIGVIGTVELAGEEVATVSSQAYSYPYSARTPIVIQAINSPIYEEKNIELFLEDFDQTLTIKFDLQGNI